MNCLLKYIIERKREGWVGVTGRRGRRRKQLLDDLKERSGCRKLKGESLDLTAQKIRFGIGYGPDMRHTAYLIN